MLQSRLTPVLALLLLAVPALAQDRPAEGQGLNPALLDERVAEEWRLLQQDRAARYRVAEPEGATAAASNLAGTPVLEVENADEAVRLRLNADGGFVVPGTQGSGTIPATGAGTRMMWFPSRSAFRAGVVSSFGSTYWDESNVGIGSVAFGENTRASGAMSFAAGLATTASGAESVALGNNATASADRTFSFNGTANAVGAVAIGSGAQATGDDALAMGPSSIAGGLASIVIGPSIANGNFGVAIGLQNSASGQFSVAIGKNARTENRQGAIVISDASASFSSDYVSPDRNNQFVVRGSGGIKMITSANARPENGAVSGVEVAPGGGSWSSISDRNRKENFVALEGEDVLARLRSVPVSTWNYLTQDSGIRHAGPMAQDFHAAFGLGESDLLINTGDIAGINMAGVQALEARTTAQQDRIEMLEQENATLRERLAALEAEQTALAARLEAEQAAESAALRQQLAAIEAALASSAVSALPPTAVSE